MVAKHRRPRSIAMLATCFGLLSSIAVTAASPICPDEQKTRQGVKDPAVCKKLHDMVRQPSAKPLNEYEKIVNEYFNNYCYRDEEGGWKVDKRIRDTGPWIGTYANGEWKGEYYGTHAPVLVWYSPEMYAWLKANRAKPAQLPPQIAPVIAPPGPPPPPVPDGAIMVKEMYVAPAAACAGIDPYMLLPTTNDTAVMIRDSKGSRDGWFWGWWGGSWSSWAVDWPAASNSPYPNMGFGQYCTNCHASAENNHTFAALKNIKGEVGDPLVFLSQNFFLDPSWQGLHTRIVLSAAQDAAAAGNDPPYDPTFTKLYWSMGGPPLRSQIVPMQPETYDNVW